MDGLSPQLRKELDDMARLFAATWTPTRRAGRLDCDDHDHDDADDYIVDD